MRTANAFCSQEVKQKPYLLSSSKGEKAAAGGPVYPAARWGAAESGRDCRVTATYRTSQQSRIVNMGSSHRDGKASGT